MQLHDVICSTCNDVQLDSASSCFMVSMLVLIPGKIKKYTQLTSNIKTWRWSYSQSSLVPQPTKSIPSEIDVECTLDLYLLLEPNQPLATKRKRLRRVGMTMSKFEQGRAGESNMTYLISTSNLYSFRLC